MKPQRNLDAEVKAFAAKRSTPKSFHDVPTPDVEATPETTSAATPDLHSALLDVGDSLMKYYDKPASLASIGHSLKQVALKIAPSPPDIGRSPEPTGGPEIGSDTSGL